MAGGKEVFIPKIALHQEKQITITPSEGIIVHGVQQERRLYLNQERGKSNRTITVASSSVRRDSYIVRDVSIDTNFPFVNYFFDDETSNEAGTLVSVGIVDAQLDHRVGELYQKTGENLSGFFHVPPSKKAYSKPERELFTKESAVTAVEFAVRNLLQIPGVLDSRTQYPEGHAQTMEVVALLSNLSKRGTSESLERRDIAIEFLNKLATDCARSNEFSWIQTMALFNRADAAVPIESILQFSKTGEIREGTQEYALAISMILDKLSTFKDQIDGIPVDRHQACIFSKNEVLYGYVPLHESGYYDIQTHITQSIDYGKPVMLGGGYTRTFFLDDNPENGTKEITVRLALDGKTAEDLYFPFVFPVEEAHKIATDLRADFSTIGTTLIPITIEHPSTETVITTR